jgi:tRNA U55 pseudouridine synthase TruB
MHNLGEPLPSDCEEFIAYKPIGLTPRELVDEYLRRFPDKLTRGSFSGRLDPMAHGAIHLFFNGRCGDAAKFHGRAKCYQFKMIFGVGTSSLDLMGVPNFVSSGLEFSPSSINAAIGEIQRRGVQKLPHCCSYPLRNSAGLRKPLWWWALMGRVDEIRDVIPTFNRSIYRWNILDISKIKLEDICDLAAERVDKVSRQNVFHQDHIIQQWRALKETCGQETMQQVEIEIEVSAGFYIRKLVEDIGTILGVAATTVEIRRMHYV